MSGNGGAACQELGRLGGPDRAHARAYMKGIGFGGEDLRADHRNRQHLDRGDAVQLHLRAVGEKVKEGVRKAGPPMEFNTVAVSDGVDGDPGDGPPWSAAR